MRESQRKIERLCRLARDARQRKAALTAIPAEEAGWIARRALKETTEHQGKGGPWSDYFERLCWWGAAAAAAACLAVAAIRPEPRNADAMELLLHWPSDQETLIEL